MIDLSLLYSGAIAASASGGGGEIAGDGAFSDPLHEVSGTGVSIVHIYGDGNIQSEVCSISGAADITSIGIGNYTTGCGQVKGIGINSAVIGRFQPNVDSVLGNGTVGIVGTGRFIQPKQRVSGIGISGDQVSAAVITTSVDVVRGQGSVGIVGWGAFSDPVGVIAATGDAVLSVIGFGTFNDPKHRVSGRDITHISGDVRFITSVDSINANGDHHALGIGSYSTPVDTIKASGTSSAYATGTLSFGRASQEPILSIPIATAPLSFSREVGTAEKTPGPTVTPLEFSRN